MLATLHKLGVTPSFSRPKVSEDNPYSEALFKTLKYCPLYPQGDRFSGIKDPRAWAEKFVNWYNNEHLYSGINWVTPASWHFEKDKKFWRIESLFSKMVEDKIQFVGRRIREIGLVPIFWS